MNKNDPYNDKKKCHKAGKVNQRGQASALCYKTPRPIPRTERYVIFTNEGVNCKKCLNLIGPRQDFQVP